MEGLPFYFNISKQGQEKVQPSQTLRREKVGSKEEKPGERKGYKKRPILTPKDILETWIIIFLTPLSWIFPANYWKIFLWPLATIFYFICGGKNQQRVKKIRKTIFTHLDDPKPESIEITWVKNAFEQRTQYLREYGPKGWKPEIKIHGVEFIENAIESGKGAILWVAPFFFNNLVVKKGLSQAGYSIIHLSSFSHGPSISMLGIHFINPLFLKIEEKYLEERIVIQPAHSRRFMDAGTGFAHIRKLEEKLRNNKIITLNCEPDFQQKYELAKLLSGKMPLATGAPTLALATGSALMPVFTLQKNPEVFEVIVEKPLILPEKGKRHDKVNLLMIDFAKLLEEFVVKYPTSFRFWHEIVSK